MRRAERFVDDLLDLFRRVDVGRLIGDAGRVGLLLGLGEKRPQLGRRSAFRAASIRPCASRSATWAIAASMPASLIFSSIAPRMNRCSVCRPAAFSSSLRPDLAKYCCSIIDATISDISGDWTSFSTSLPSCSPEIVFSRNPFATRSTSTMISCCSWAGSCELLIPCRIPPSRPLPPSCANCARSRSRSGSRSPPG